MGLFVSTVSADVRIDDLGLLISHPTTDRDMSNFTGEELARSIDLENAIRGGTLTWRETAGGTTRPAADYDRDYWDVMGESSGPGNADDRAVIEGLAKVHRLLMYPDEYVVANSTLTLTVVSHTHLRFTGTTAGQIVRLPVATTLIKGWRYEFSNASNKTIQVQDGAGVNLFVLDSNSKAFLELADATTTAGTWFFWQVLANSIASGVINYNIVSSAAFNTTSITDVLITGFQFTPQAGTYACFLNAASHLTTTPKAHWWSFYRGGTKMADSERTQDTAHSNQNMVDTTMTVAYFDGAQTLDVRVRTSNGTLTIKSRTMLLIRLGA